MRGARGNLSLGGLWPDEWILAISRRSASRKSSPKLPDAMEQLFCARHPGRIAVGRLHARDRGLGGRADPQRVSSGYRIAGDGCDPLGCARAPGGARRRWPQSSFFATVITIQHKAGGNLPKPSAMSRVLPRAQDNQGGKIQAMSMEAKALCAIKLRPAPSSWLEDLYFQPQLYRNCSG